MRGKRKPRRRCLSGARITPAHAGKTSSHPRNTIHEPDHPRACGENTRSMIPEVINNGSPPRMRGKLSRNFRFFACRRITPAHAGKTLRLAMACAIRADHPRACGENRFSRHASSIAYGSPPRMRGKPRGEIRQTMQQRITPAHAGKTCRCHIQFRQSPDHPRACGENTKVETGSGSYSGSPPRMRGKRSPV